MVYLRQIVHESQDVINLSAECRRRTSAGNDTDIYGQIFFSDQPSQDMACHQLPIIYTSINLSNVH